MVAKNLFLIFDAIKFIFHMLFLLRDKSIISPKVYRAGRKNAVRVVNGLSYATDDFSQLDKYR